ncbi:hypothetical protein LXJ15735_26650 [Lacrimispora xylanolytica]|jgi:hypothetical protein|uniref:Uncharacterized protein n=1 Tax=Lacrimispora xylanolytica TaxID=29375 RepID=A0ABY7AA24_9FIRM|nr:MULTISPECIES: hypothetical protein [Clostridia]MBS5958700.1 hypothetical protein [Clostridiales bacterium]WAJ22377.1 hypothetical protein OW255_12400 [Lacrimispora xylanolytica]
MEEFYQAIEDTIRMTGYNGPVNGEEIYNEISDEIEDKEPGAYVFMSKKTDDVFYEYKIQIFEDQFNLSAVDIHTPTQVYHADFD